MTDIAEAVDVGALEPLSLDASLSIHARMLAILSELPPIGKTQENVQQHFMYRGHDDVLNALNPLMAKHGVYITPRVLERLTGERSTSRGSTMYEVNLHVEFTFWGLAGDLVIASAWGEGTDMGDKSTNKAMTMAFKNVLAQAFAVSTRELSDSDGDSPEETSRGQRERLERVEVGHPVREFDPGKDLAPGAITVRVEDDAVAVRQALRDLDDTRNWVDIEDEAVQHVFNVLTYDELDGTQRREFWTRLANAVVRLNELAGPGDFPPGLPDPLIQLAYGWAFKDVELTEEALSALLTPSGVGADAGALPEDEQP